MSGFELTPIEGKQYIGAYMNEKAPRTIKEKGDREVQEFQDTAVRNVAIVPWFHRFDPEFAFPRDASDAAHLNGSIPAITWEPDPSGPPILDMDRNPNPANIIVRINRMAKDHSLLRAIYENKLELEARPELRESYELYSYIRTFAQEARLWTEKNKSDILLRPFHEMNIDHPWGMVPEEFKPAFITLWKIFREDEGAAHVKFAWSPDASHPNLVENMLDYLPGYETGEWHKYVDWIGFDVYNKKGNWRSPKKLMGNAVAKLKPLIEKAKRVGKKVGLAVFELGCEDQLELPKEKSGLDSVADYLIHKRFRTGLHRFVDIDKDAKADQLKEYYDWMLDNDIQLSLYFHQNKLERDYTFKFWGANSDRAKKAFREATEDDDFIKTFDPHKGDAPTREEILRPLLSLRLDLNKDLERFAPPGKSVAEYKASINPKVLKRQARLYREANKILQNFRSDVGGRRDWVMEPDSIWASSNEYVQFSHDLITLGLFLTKIGKYDMAIRAYSAVPTHKGLTRLRKTALLGMANCYLYRIDDGDWGKAVGIFNWLIHVTQKEWEENRSFTTWHWSEDKKYQEISEKLGRLENGDRKAKRKDQIRLERKLKRKRVQLASAKQRHKELLRRFNQTGDQRYKILADKSKNQISALERALTETELEIKSYVPFEEAKIPLPQPEVLAYKNIEDLLFMSRLEIGLGLGFSFMGSDWRTTRKLTLPHLLVALRYWELTGKSEWYMEPIESEVYLAWSGLWAFYPNEYVALDKVEVFFEKIRAAKAPFEKRGWFNRFWLGAKGPEEAEKLLHPKHITVGNWLTRSEIQSKYPGDRDIIIEAGEHLQKEVYPETLVETHLVRALSIEARVQFKRKDYPGAIQICKRVLKMLEERPQDYPIKLYAWLTTADSQRLSGETEKAKETYEKVLRILKYAPGTNYVKLQARLGYAEVLESLGLEEQSAQQEFKALAPLLRFELEGMQQKEFVDQLDKAEGLDELLEIVQQLGERNIENESFLKKLEAARKRHKRKVE